METVHPDGSVSVNLQGRFQSAAVARLTEDGTLFICSDADEAVEHALHETPASAWEVQGCVDCEVWR